MNFSRHLIGVDLLLQLVHQIVESVISQIVWPLGSFRSLSHPDSFTTHRLRIRFVESSGPTVQDRDYKAWEISPTAQRGPQGETT